MKKELLSITILSIAFCNSIISQTAGNLTFTFTPVAKSPCYTGSRNVIAVWIQTNSGAFVKTKLRNAGSGTSDHLPTFAVNSGGSSSNCISTACNVVSATTGATRTSFLATTINWDGTDATGTLVSDGTYKVTIEETWNHGTSSTAVTSYTFTKGPTADSQLPAANTYYTGVKLDWIPGVAGLTEAKNQIPEVVIYPNPTNGIFNIDFKRVNTIAIFNTMGINVYSEKNENETNGIKTIDLSSFANGIYIIRVSNEKGVSNHKLILNK